ncbi:hypothetical protein J2M53_09290 [Arthrobacter sp. zg-ZUI100]|uniref:hypothetical protein n=1 Tax=Arthrobacter jiangjiafuii TaxID=2817475 RepID=UPI001AEEBD2D|nr:hypothetical protein [Arthrobacter jiangjiafuii]MBP3036446.1 hypothetical protein [Arthrobacter jiangjiafuii]
MTAGSWVPDAAAFLSSDLSSSFGGVEFQLAPSQDFASSGIAVSWTDGPPLYAVEIVVARSACRFELVHWGVQTCQVAGIVTKRRTMSPHAEAKILSLLADALGTHELDAEQVHSTPPLLTLQDDRCEMGTLPEFLDRLFEQMTFCRECPAPTSGGNVLCPCIKIRSPR